MIGIRTGTRLFKKGPRRSGKPDSLSLPDRRGPFFTLTGPWTYGFSLIS